MHDKLIKLLQQVTFFNGLDEEHIIGICEKSRVLSFNKDDIIFCQGHEANAFFLVIKGWVAITKENKDAEQVVLHVFKRGESFAEPAAIIMGKYPASAYAASDCELLEIRIPALKKMIKTDPDIAMRMIARLSGQLNTLINDFEKYKTFSAPKRLAIFLLELLAESPDGTTVQLPFNKNILASHLGIQPGTLSRSLNKLSNYGVNSDRSGYIIFENKQLLQDYIDKTE